MHRTLTGRQMQISACCCDDWKRPKSCFGTFWHWPSRVQRRRGHYSHLGVLIYFFVPLEIIIGNNWFANSFSDEVDHVICCSGW